MKAIPWVLAAALLLSSSTALAGLIALEQFEDYAVSDELDGLSDGHGWTGAWDVPTPAREPNLTVVDGGLSYKQGAVFNDGGDRALRLLMAGSGVGDIDEIATRAFPNQTGTVYMSLLFETATADGSPSGDDFVQYGMNNNTSNPRTSVSHRKNTAFDPDDFDFHARSGTGGSPFAGIGTELDRTYFLVIRASDVGTPGNYDRVELWVDPLSPSPGAADAVHNTNSGISNVQQFVHRIAFLETGDEYTIDNIRIGTSFSDVIPTPEPGTLLVWTLLGLCWLGASARRRRSIAY